MAIKKVKKDATPKAGWEDCSRIIKDSLHLFPLAVPAGIFNEFRARTIGNLYLVAYQMQKDCYMDDAHDLFEFLEMIACANLGDLTICEEVKEKFHTAYDKARFRESRANAA
jgi:hypothetical protein